jgi:predicted RNA-binding protein with EMAP domain
LHNETDPAEILEEVLGTLVEWHEKALDTADHIRYVLKHGADFDRAYPAVIHEMMAANFEQMINYITTGQVNTGPIPVVREVGD